MRKKYDIFISYRRLDNSGNTSGRDIARTIKLGLEKRGYKAFFDNGEIRDNEFESTIIPAVRDSKYFLLVLSKDALDRCINPDDWVRREIFEALNAGCKIIPVSPDEQFKGWSTSIPEAIGRIKGLQVSNVSLGSLFEKSIDKLIAERFERSRHRLIYLSILLVSVIICFFVFWSKSDCRLFPVISDKICTESNVTIEQRDIRFVISTFMQSFGDTGCYWGVFSDNDALVPKTSNVAETSETSSWSLFSYQLEYCAELYYNGAPYSVDELNHACVCSVCLYGSRSGPDLLYITNIAMMNDPESSYPEKLAEEMGFERIEEGGVPSYAYEVYSKDNGFYALLEFSGGSAGTSCGISITRGRDILTKYIEYTFKGL